MPLVAVSHAAPSRWPHTSAALRPVAVLRMALVLLFLGNLGRIPFLDLGERQAPILLNDICLAAVLATGFLAMVSARSLRINDVAFAAFIFASIGFISAVASVPRYELSAFELIASLAYLARWGVYFAIYLVVINCVKARDAESVWTALERALLLIAAFGIVQAVVLRDFAIVVYPQARKYVDWDLQGTRLVSTILDPNVVAAMIAAVLLVQIARLASGVRVALWKPLLMLAALVMTLSRSGVLALTVGCFVIFLVSRLRKPVLRFAGVAAVLFLAALPKVVTFGLAYSKFSLDESALARVVQWQRAIELLAEHPWFGIGFNTYGFVQDHRGFERLGASAYSAEGGLLFIAVMTGFIGLAVYLGMLWLVLRRNRSAWRDARATPEERGLLLGTGATTVAIVVHAAFVNSLFTPFVMEMLWVLWGLSFVVATDVRRRQLDTRPQPLEPGVGGARAEAA